MEYIADQENVLDSQTWHSFHPESWPGNVPQGPSNATGQMEQTHRVHGSEYIPKAQRFLPCHYFDFNRWHKHWSVGYRSVHQMICRLIVIRLIVILLGRLRMTVADCIIEYQRIGEQVFGKPRMFSTLRFGFGNRPKYQASRLEECFRGIASRRDDASEERKRLFPSGRGMCKT